MMDIVERCNIHALKADDAGMYTTGDVLWIAAREITKLRKQLATVPTGEEGVCADCGVGAGEHASTCVRVIFDYKHEDAITFNVPEGYDTILGYLAKHHPDVLDTFDYSDPEATQRDGWKLSHLANRTGSYVYVNAPPCLHDKGILTVRAYPIALLETRWGRT